MTRMRILTVNARVLLAVLENPDYTQQQLADLLGMRYQHVWRALDKLVKEGILTKTRYSRRTRFAATENLLNMQDMQRLKACIFDNNVVK